MPVTATPVFPQAPLLSVALVTAGNTSSQGVGTIGTDIFLAQGITTNGMFIERVRFSPTASTPTSTTPTVGRVFWSTVSSGATTSSNTHLLGEILLPNTAADNATASAPSVDLILNMSIPASATILITNHVAPALNTLWKANVIGGLL
jgi:hypothetical protein